MVTIRKSGIQILVLSALSVAGTSQASGLYFYEMGTSDLGLAAAGSAARAADASTIYTNPAGMTKLDGGEVSLGAQLLYGGLDYSLQKGEGPGNVVGWQPDGSLFYSQSVADNVWLGLGLYSNAGLSLDFGDDWKGQSLLDKAQIMFTTLQPTMAWRINNNWSIGGGVTITQGRVKVSSGNLPGGKQLVDEFDIDYAYGARLGVLYEMSPATRFGLAWNNEQRYRFDIDRSITSPLTGNTLLLEQATMNLPQQIMGSVYHKLNERWAVMGNLGWQEWDSFTNNNVSSNARTVDSTLKLQNTWHIALGAQYQLTYDLLLNGGVAYDSSWNNSDAEGSFIWPSSQAWRFGTGVQYALSKSSEVGVAVEYLRGSSLKDPAPVLAGEYDSPYMVFLGAQYIYRF